MFSFLGLVILRGSAYYRRSEIRDLFYGPLSRPFYRATMTVNRFKHLLRVLRFDDRETTEERKKLDKFAVIGDIFEKFNGLLRVYYSPSESIHHGGRNSPQFPGPVRLHLLHAE